jgi:cytochrome P450
MSERPNLMSPEVRANPYPLYARLRRESPICQAEPRGMWLLTRQDDVLFALKRPEIFSSSRLAGALSTSWLERPHPLASAMSFADPPRHGRLRGLVQQAFTPAAVERMRPFVRSVAEPLVDQLLRDRQVDFIQAFALPLTSSMVGHLMGLDTFLFRRVKRWAEDVVAISSMPPGNVARQAQVRSSMEELTAYLEDAIAARRDRPQGDVVSALAHARVDGEALTQQELLGVLFLLLVAGLETMVHLLGHALWILRESPELFHRVRADLTQMPRFLEELLRYEPPAQGVLRVTTTEVELGGVLIPAGALVMPLIASALRDERYVQDGERFDMERKQPSHLAFGHGIHFCVGAPLARMTAGLGLEVLLPRCEALGGRPEKAEWSRALTMRGLTSMPLEVVPRQPLA